MMSTTTNRTLWSNAMRHLSIALILAGIAVGAATAYFAMSGAPEQAAPAGPAGELVSGPKVGDKLPGTFDALNLNGADAGEECCMHCKYGNAAVAMVFAAKPNPALTELVKKLESSAAGAKGEFGACVVVTDTREGTTTELKKLSEKLALKHVVLAVADPAKLKHYSLHADAEATVLLYSNRVIRANRAFKAGELTEKAAAEIGTQASEHFAAK
jgi:hypothetical protein